MKKKKSPYTDAPPAVEKALKASVRIKDTLPSPAELMAKEDSTAKITIAVSRKSLDAFKTYARQHHGKYQVMIRRLIDNYAENVLGSGK